MSKRAAGLRLAFAAALAVAAPAHAAEHQVTIAQMSYGTLPSEAHVGDTIVWTNRDIVVHTVTTRDGHTDLVLQPQQSVRVPVIRAGAVAIYCRFHPNMQGRLNFAPR